MKNDPGFGRTYGWSHRWLQAPSVRILRKVQKSWARTRKILIQFLVEERENVGAAETHELNSPGFIYAEPEYCSHNYTELTLTSSSWTGLTSCLFFKRDCDEERVNRGILDWINEVWWELVRSGVCQRDADAQTRNGSLLLFKICNITTSRKIASSNEQNNNNNNNNMCVMKLQ